MKLALITSLLLSITFSAAAAKQSACVVCTQAEKAKVAFAKDTEKGLDECVALLDKFRPSKDKDLQKKEFRAVLDLAAYVLPKNDEGEVDDLLFSLYEDHKAEIDAELKTMSPGEQKIIRDSLDHMAKISDEGNG